MWVIIVLGVLDPTTQRVLRPRFSSFSFESSTHRCWSETHQTFTGKHSLSHFSSPQWSCRLDGISNWWLYQVLVCPLRTKWGWSSRRHLYSRFGVWRPLLSSRQVLAFCFISEMALALLRVPAVPASHYHVNIGVLRPSLRKLSKKKHHDVGWLPADWTRSFIWSIGVPQQISGKFC